MTKKLSPDTLGIVKDVRALLSGPDRWARHWFAFDANGTSCPARSDKAVCWCLAGAFEKVANQSLASFAFNEFAQQFPDRQVSNWNDSQTLWEDVRDMLDAIIRKNES